MRIHTKIKFISVTAFLLLLCFLLPTSFTFALGLSEKSTSTRSHSLLSAAEIAAFVPMVRGKFTFPAPYNTEGYRITLPSDCPANTDCVKHVGYSYWDNMNNSAGSNILYMFVTLDRNMGGEGPTLFSLDKTTGNVSKVGALFSPEDVRSYGSGEGWYFSATKPTTLYINISTQPTLLRYDVLSHTTATVFDISSQPSLYGANRYIWQVHSSADDTVHSFSVRESDTYAFLGCGAYLETTQQFKFYPKRGEGYDECQIDKSGRWLLIKEQVDNKNGEDNRIIDLSTGAETVFLDENGAAGHSDMGFGYLLAADNWYSLPALRLWQFGTSPLGPGTVVYKTANWNTEGFSHVSFSSARADVPIEKQYACGSGASSVTSGQDNQIVCFKMDGSLDTVVVAPVMTDLNASGGGTSYEKSPKGNLDPTGQYFMWTSNLADGRLEAFVVKVPTELLAPGVSVAVPPAPLPVPPPAPIPVTIPTPTPTPTPVTVASPAPSPSAPVAFVPSALPSPISAPVQTVPVPPPAPSPTPLPTATISFTQNLRIGMRGNDVKKLQEYLISKGYLTVGNNTGYFGKLTFAAVRLFQSANGVPSTGYFGPLSRKKLVEISG